MEIVVSKPVIQVKNAGKKFASSLRRAMIYGAQDIFYSSFGRLPATHFLRPGEFWAVEDVSFDLQRGGALGIIGANGSGKTTFLRMLNGIFMPDKGRIEVSGRVGGLIHVGAGFHPMLTGRENIYVNGAIMGMSCREIRRKIEAIIAFADLGDFLDVPVKQYSSGMYVRLGFAVAVHSEPDILLLDEVLAVGDRDFQLKCYQKLHELRATGATVVLVSHNEHAIREMTGCCLYLDHGRSVFFGASEDAVSLYLKDVYVRRAAKGVQSGGKGDIISSVRFLNETGKEVEVVSSGSVLTVELVLDCPVSVDRPMVAVNFYNEEGLVYGAHSAYEKVDLGKFPAGRSVVHMDFSRFDLPSRNYRVSVSLADGHEMNLRDVRHMAYSLVVGRAPDARGSLKIPVRWSVSAGQE